MSEMIERVARAMAEELPMSRYDIGANALIPCTWAEVDGLHKEVYRRRARTAIAAMREPTQAMRECGHGAGWSGLLTGIDEPEEKAAGLLFAAMIDAALKP